MKKMLVVLPQTVIGGMERSCVNFINMSNYCKDFEITLLIGKNEDDSLFKQMPNNVKIKILYKGKSKIFGKIASNIKLLIEYFKCAILGKKYDVSICYTHHFPIYASLTRRAAKRNIGFIHNDLEKSLSKKRMKKMKFEKFSRIVCVSNSSKDVFKKIFPDYPESNLYVINNYIDGENIIKLSESNVQEDFLKDNKTTFINISRHVEKHKKISRILYSAEKLKKEGYEFKVILVGSGNETTGYIKLIEEKNLTDTVIYVGKKANPYNYLRLSDALILSSEYEGYGMVLDEARVLNKPIIVTNVADAKNITSEGYGILCNNSAEGVYLGMKQYLEEGYQINKKFDYKRFNEIITEKLDYIVNY